MIIILLYYVLMASVFTFGQKVILYADPLFLTGIRIMSGVLCFLAYQYYKDRAHFYIKKESINYVFAMGVTICFVDSLRFSALRYIPASNGALIGATAPFIAALLTWWWFNEQFSSKRIMSLCVGLVGMLPLLLSHLTAADSSCKHILLAYFMMFCSTFCFVLNGILSKTLINRQGNSFFMVLGCTMTLAGLLGFVFSFIFEPWNPVPISQFYPAIKLIVYLFFTQSLLGYALYNYLVQRYAITLVAFAQLSVPLFSALLAFFLYGEAMNIQFFISLILLTCALLLFYSETPLTRKIT